MPGAPSSVLYPPPLWKVPWEGNGTCTVLLLQLDAQPCPLVEQPAVFGAHHGNSDNASQQHTANKPQRTTSTSTRKLRVPYLDIIIIT